MINPYTGNFDFITKVDSTTLPVGSAAYIQNAASPTIATQKFNVQRGKYSAAGFVMNDGTNRWGVTISPTGTLIFTPK